MDRELLIEIGCEEIPASWLPGLTRAARRRISTRGSRSSRLDTGRAGRKLQHAAPADRARREAGRAADRLRGAGHRPAGVGRVQAGRRADAGGGRLREEIQRRGGGARAQRDTEGHYLAYRVHQRGKATVDVLADVMGGAAARPDLPEADALGRVSRGRQGRPGVRAADPLAGAALRRPRRAVRHPADRDRAGSDWCRTSAPGRTPTAIAS